MTEQAKKVLDPRLYMFIASVVWEATHNTPEAKVGLFGRQHARGANNHPAYLAVREHLEPLLKELP